MRRRIPTRSICPLPTMALLALALASTAAFVGCKPDSGESEAAAKEGGSESVVLYTSADETFARQVVAYCEEKTGLKITMVGDSEAGKTTGLVRRIELEKDRPQADVFWSSEQSMTVQLARKELLVPYDSPVAEDIPAQFKDSQHRWTGFALRARVVAYDPARLETHPLPKTWKELATPEFASTVAIANPLFGTTRSHVAAMYALWGAEPFDEWLTLLVDNRVVLADSNSATVRKMLANEVLFAMTDTDDVLVASTEERPLKMLFLDMGDGGTMVIPNTVALIANSPNPDAGRRLIDCLLSPEVETMLYRSKSGNYPVRASLREELGVELPEASKVPFTDIADSLNPAISLVREKLLK